MLYLRAYIEDTSKYDSIQSWYGPFYYVYEYLIHTSLNVDVSHDITRLKTITLWGLIALAIALFVHRTTRSLVLSVIAQILLLFHLKALDTSPGHPQEIALLLIACSLCFTGYVRTSGERRFSMIGLGAILGALFLVKINVGAYLAVALALSMLFCLPHRLLERNILRVVSLAAVVLPAVIMWRHSFGPSLDQNYCIVVTLVIAASLVATLPADEKALLGWSDMGWTACTLFLSIVCICGLAIAWGASLGGIVDMAVLRAMRVPSVFHVSANVGQDIVRASLLSVLLAIGYRVFVQRINSSTLKVLALSSVKLTYGLLSLYSMYRNPGMALMMVIPLPFLWIVLVDPGGDTSKCSCERFPRVFVCFAAAFQALQAYPSPGSQLYWSGILLVPLAIICIGDAITASWSWAERHSSVAQRCRPRSWRGTVVALITLTLAISWFYRESNLTGLRDRYWNLTALELPGAVRVRLTARQVAELRGLVDNIKTHCDSFIGLPGAPSLYFWTGIQPPEIFGSDWLHSLEDERQKEIIEIMGGYARPCVVYNPKMVRFWNKERNTVSRAPLLEYIRTRFIEFNRFGDYRLLVWNKRAFSPPAANKLVNLWVIDPNIKRVRQLHQPALSNLL